jgi:uncharacterized membrane protein YphA (DoxX/SURF4 family)
MTVLHGPLIVAASLLVVAGTSKLRQPASPAAALRAIGLPVPAAAGAAIGAFEVVLGAVALVTGNTVAVAGVAATYAAFAAFVVVARRRGAARSCGCFGVDDTPPSTTHLAVDLVLATTCAAAAVAGVPSLATVLDDQPGGGLPLLVTAVTATLLLRAVLTDLVQARQAWHPS